VSGRVRRVEEVGLCGCEKGGREWVRRVEIGKKEEGGLCCYCGEVVQRYVFFLLCGLIVGFRDVLVWWHTHVCI
jgi:hypothetical protein